MNGFRIEEKHVRFPEMFSLPIVDILFYSHSISFAYVWGKMSDCHTQIISACQLETLVRIIARVLNIS